MHKNLLCRYFIKASKNMYKCISGIIKGGEELTAYRKIRAHRCERDKFSNQFKNQNGTFKPLRYHNYHDDLFILFVVR